MINLNKKNTLVFALIFMVAGIICLIFYKTNAIFGCLSCLFLGVGFIFLGKTNKFRYQSNLVRLDKKLEEMLKDVEINGELSEYNGFSENEQYKILRQFIKKNKRKDIYCYIFGGAFIFMAIFMLI